MIKHNHIVVDDNATNNLICKYIIRRFTDQVRINMFSDPEAALDYIADEYVQKQGRGLTLLFLDINMPCMTGWEFLDRFEKLGGEIHRQFIIYMLSSSVDDRDKEKAAANPFVSGFISKPLTAENIKKVYTNHNLVV